VLAKLGVGLGRGSARKVDDASARPEET
jgi:hypothetical protein